MVLASKICTALTVLVASNFSILIRTTHYNYKIGSVVTIGCVHSKQNVDQSLFQNIIFVTMPIAYDMSASVIELLLLVFFDQK